MAILPHERRSRCLVKNTPYPFFEEVGYFQQACGIYCILNTTNGKRYVGSGVMVLDRWRAHQKNAGTVEFQGELVADSTDFRFLILEFCTPPECAAREQYWMNRHKVLDPARGYNKQPKAQNGFMSHIAKQKAFALRGKEKGIVTMISLKELEKRLNHRGVSISYSSLSELLNTDDVSEQLGITGAGNLRRIPLEAVETLYEFLPQFRALKGRKPQLANSLRSFMKQPNSETVSTSLAVVPNPQTPFVAPPSNGLTTAEVVALLETLPRIEALLQTRVALPAPEDALLLIRVAHEQYGVSMAALRRLSVLEGGRRKVFRSEVLAYLAEVKARNG